GWGGWRCVRRGGAEVAGEPRVRLRGGGLEDGRQRRHRARRGPAGGRVGRRPQLEPDRGERDASVRGSRDAGPRPGRRAPGRRRPRRRGTRVRRRIAVLRDVGRGEREAVNFAFSDEQEELRRTVRKFLETKSPMSDTRRLMETDEGSDDVVWKQMGQELALQGMHVPEEYGGQG